MTDSTYESTFQADIISHMQANGWQLPSGYVAKTALYERDVLDFVHKSNLPL